MKAIFSRPKIVITIIFLGVLLLVPLGLSVYAVYQYFKIFNGPFSAKQEVWGQFGDLVGGLLNPALSFYALMAAVSAIGYQMYEGNKARKNSLYQFFESTFFKLLEIHTKKLELIRFENNEGPTVFSTMVSNFNSLVLENITRRFLRDPPPTFDNLIDKWLQTMTAEFHANYAQDCVNQINSEPKRNKLEVVKEVLARYGSPPEEAVERIFANSGDELKRQAIDEFSVKLPKSEFELIFRESSDKLYKDYGNIYGHYFRNMSMMLDHLDSIDTDTSSKFGKLFRAQLSRSEIAMLLINCVSSQTSKRFNTQVFKYDLFNGLEAGDLRYGSKLLEQFYKEF
jgi:hypothetical protein